MYKLTIDSCQIRNKFLNINKKIRALFAVLERNDVIMCSGIAKKKILKLIELGVNIANSIQRVLLVGY